MSDSRTSNAKSNILFGYIGKIIDLLLPFATRTIILYVLGEKYLGLSSLFTSLLGVLSLTELGFSSAVVFSLYKPLAEKDEETVKAYLTYYKQIYRIIGLVILGVGVCLMPFLPLLIKGEVPADINIYILYLLYLVNTSISYLAFAYKSSLLQASQKASVSSKIVSAIHLCRGFLQILVLLISKSYYLFVAVMVLCSLANNLITNYTVNKIYPQYMGKGSLDKEKRTDLFVKVKGLAISKACVILRDSLDSITLSAFVGLTAVAIYGNYHYILAAIHSLMTVITFSIKAGVGNSVCTESVEKNASDMLTFQYLYMFLASWCFSCLLCLSQDFMTIWAGPELLTDNFTMALFAAYFFSLCMGDVRNLYIDAKGFWWEYRYLSILETVVNLVFNVVSVYFFGLTGVLVATLLSFWSINLISGCVIVFRDYFGKDALKAYVKQNLWILLSCGVTSGITWMVCQQVHIQSAWLQLFAKAGICVVLPTLLYIVVNIKNPYMKKLPAYCKRLLRR